MKWGSTGKNKKGKKGYIKGAGAHTQNCKNGDAVKYEINPYHPRDTQEWGCMPGKSANAPFPINIVDPKDGKYHPYFLKQMKGRGAANDYLAMVLSI